jgi:predicted RND superfamily exporter protein
VFLITHLLRFSARHPRVVVTLAGAITVCALFFIPRIQLRLDGRSLIPSGLPEFAEGNQAASRFELRDLVLIGVGNEESGVYTPETLQRIARLSDGLSRVNGIVAGSVVSLSTVPRIALVDGKVDTSPLYRPQDQLNKVVRKIIIQGRNCRGGPLWPPFTGNNIFSTGGRPQRAAPTVTSTCQQARTEER